MTPSNKKFPVVTLLGSSTKFKDEFKRLEKELTLQGEIVISLGFFNEKEDFIPTDEQKNMLVQMMKQKIEMSDKLFVINPNGYIGQHTRDEIEYAKSLGKEIIYMEP